MKRPHHSIAGLSERAGNALLNALGHRGGQPPSPRQVAKLIDGIELGRVPNCGKKTIREIADWLTANGETLRSNPARICSFAQVIDFESATLTCAYGHQWVLRGLGAVPLSRLSQRCPHCFKP